MTLGKLMYLPSDRKWTVHRFGRGIPSDSWHQRIAGLFSQLPSTFRENDPTYDFCQKATDNLVGQGFQECCNYSLRSGEEILAWHADLDIEKLALANPLSSDHTHICFASSGTVNNLAHNQKNFNDIVRFFETGRVFRPGQRGNLECISIAFIALEQPNSRQWKSKEKTRFF